MADNTGSFLLGFTIGAMAGAAVALLMAPQSGEETIQQLQDRGIELKGQVQTQAERLAEEARSRAQEASEQAKDRTQQLSGTVKGQVEHVQERGRIVLTESARRAQHAVNTAQEKLQRPEDVDSGTVAG